MRTLRILLWPPLLAWVGMSVMIGGGVWWMHSSGDAWVAQAVSIVGATIALLACWHRLCADLWFYCFIGLGLLGAFGEKYGLQAANFYGAMIIDAAATFVLIMADDMEAAKWGQYYSDARMARETDHRGRPFVFTTRRRLP